MNTLKDLLQNEYFKSGLYLVGSIILARIIHFVLKKYVTALTRKTKSDLDDLLLKILIKPIYLVMILVGIYLSLNSLSIPEPYPKWINGTLFTLMAILIAWVISRVLALFVTREMKVQSGQEKTPKLINKVIAIVVYIIALLMILKYFNIEISPLVATLGLGGVAAGLALQKTLQNLLAGLHIISEQPIKVGDFIELPADNISGYVVDINWRSTRIRALPNNIIIIPNSKLADSIIINNAMPEPEMSTLVQVGVAYTSDLERVERITIEVGKRIQETVEGGVKDFTPLIRFHTFADSNINFTVVLRVRESVAQYAIKHEFIKALKKRYDEEGIEISWPVRKIFRGAE